ncbi:hypothetical protein [Hydrogenophaga sp.]|uniref:hypothetical protein n=1 Tax=Hydrogenophaga sp. TaxID=1904254 RepID=UPI0019974AAF|nr:hypothetical protein [Hydrogenophaga sp.]MBD3893119.1 hypothetical protein [Hydrogenophaga sp.]
MRSVPSSPDSSLTSALIGGNLGDSSYELTSRPEIFELFWQIAQQRQSASLVVLNPDESTQPQLVQSFSSNVFELDQDADTMEFDLPMAAPPVARGHLLRGSVKLHGVMLTFEAEVIGTRMSQQGRDSALITSLPRRLFRLQRRDSFRVPVPGSYKIRVSLSPEHKHLQNLRVLDVSCGGVSVLLRTLVDEVPLGRHFSPGVFSSDADGAVTSYEAQMIVRHVRSAPPSLNHLMDEIKDRNVAGGATKFQPFKLPAVASAEKFELMQLGIEFRHMSMGLERSLARLVNELALALMTRARDDVWR